MTLGEKWGRNGRLLPLGPAPAFTLSFPCLDRLCVHCLGINISCSISQFFKPMTPCDKYKKKNNPHIPFRILISCTTVHLVLPSGHCLQGKVFHLEVPLPEVELPTLQGLQWLVRVARKWSLQLGGSQSTPFLFPGEV